MKKSDLKRLLGVPDEHIEYGRKHLKILDGCGRLVMIVSKGSSKLEGAWLKTARKLLLAHGLTGLCGAGAVRNQ